MKTTPVTVYYPDTRPNAETLEGRLAQCRKDEQILQTSRSDAHDWKFLAALLPLPILGYSRCEVVVFKNGTGGVTSAQLLAEWDASATFQVPIEFPGV